MTHSNLIIETRVRGRIGGYPATIDADAAVAYQSITAAYAEDQMAENAVKTDRFLLPILRSLDARRVLDAGCGVGATVERLRHHGFEVYGYDLIENVRFWQGQQRAPDHYVVAAPIDPVLPFDDGTFDFVYTFGAIEHVGTHDGHADRRPDYHEIRTRWTRELLRVVRPGGHLLLAGPNRNFPVDTAHGPDKRAKDWELALGRRLGLTVHRPWGENFLWGYGDVRRYLQGCNVSIDALSVHDLMNFSRVPAPLRALARLYVRAIPPFLRDTGLNPWVTALVRKGVAG